MGDLPTPLKEAATSTSGSEFTLFAPTDAAFNTLFAMLPAGTAAKLKSNATAVGNLYVSRTLSGRPHIAPHRPDSLPLAASLQ